MSTDLQEILDRIGNLTPDEFKVLAETVNEVYQPKEQGNRRVLLPGTHRPTKEEVEAHLAAIFTPEQRQEIARTDISNIKLPPGAKTTVEILDEDREDRF